ncbi:hypothetical protein ACHAQI_004650 [Fusarium lateritium]
MSERQDILYIFGGALDENDLYRNYQPKPRLSPLLLDTVMDGRPRASGSKLLQLPAEILATIVDYVGTNRRAIRRLALVNSDCRQLARTRQFAKVEYNYSQKMTTLITELLKERQDRPSIKDCVRHFTYSPDPEEARKQHPMAYRLWMSEYRNYMSREDETMLDLTHAMYKSYQMAAALVASQMSNLETLIWHDQLVTSKETFTALAMSKAHSLKLRNVEISEGWSLGPAISRRNRPLRSLYLDVQVRPLPGTDDRGGRDNSQPNPGNDFFKSLFQLFAPTLESLTWLLISRPHWGPLSLDTTSKSFPRLRSLRLNSVPGSLDKQSFASLMAAPLRTLELSWRFVEDYKNVVRALEPYASLEALLIRDIDTVESISDLVRRHHTLQKLYLIQEYDGPKQTYTCYEDLLTPLGGGQFDNLRSLCLVWGGDNDDEGAPTFDMTAGSLAAISELTSLEQLALGCAVAQIFRTSGPEFWNEDMHQWIINHNTLQAYLEKLKNLQQLAFIGDTYQRGDNSGSYRHYYRYRQASEDDIEEAEENMGLDEFVTLDEDYPETIVLWEIAHLSRMIEHAQDYRDVLPNLEWIYLGQRPMQFVEHDELVEAVPVTRSRDHCTTYLKSVFELCAEDEIILSSARL